MKGLVGGPLLVGGLGPGPPGPPLNPALVNNGLVGLLFKMNFEVSLKLLQTS